jgi:multidrug efflux pump subunit AcrA (membrane-fusion protein)
VAVLDLADFRLRVEQSATALAQAAARLGVPLDGSADQIEPEQTALARQARAQLTQATAQRNRTAALHRDGILSKAELDTAEADFRVAEARYQEALEEVRSRRALVAERLAALRLAEQSLADATLRAPFDGAVRERHLSVGAYLEVRAPVATIVRSIAPAAARRAGARAAGVRVGQPVRLRAENATVIGEGKVVRLSPAIDERTRTLLVEAEIERGRRAPAGGFATADVVIDPEVPAVLVPADALVTFAASRRARRRRQQDRRDARARWAFGDGSVLEGPRRRRTIVAEPGNLTAASRSSPR